MLEKLKKFLGNDQGRVLIARVLRENGRKYLPRYIFAFCLMAMVSALTGASAWITKNIVNDVFIGQNTALIWAIAIGVLLIYAGRGLADYGQAVIMNRISREIVADHQKRIYRHLLAQDMRFFGSASIGDLVMYFSNGANAVASLMNLLMTSLGKDLMSLISLTIVMVAMDPILSIFALLIAPGAIWGVTSLKQRIRNIGHHEHAGMARIIARLKDSMIGIRVVKSFGLEERMGTEMTQNIDATARHMMKIGNLSARSGPIMEALVGFALASTIIYAGYGIAGGSRDAGSLLAFLTALLFTYAPAKSLARLNLNLEMTLIGVGAMYRFLDRAPLYQDAPDARPIRIGKGEIELKNVSFAYGGAGNALNSISVRFPAGKVSALVGSSGAGKSTIFALIERFYDPKSGAILIDGQDIRSVTTESLRRSIAFVNQDAFLFEGTIEDNIRAGRPEASDEEVAAAATAANAHEFIIEHPEGYKRLVGEGGGNLSGGQRQRITIARAMLRDAPILLLDEATSALDAVSEAKVRDALDRLMKGRTTIVIAHRLATVRKADVIHVMDNGRLVESGTHDELMKAGGTYAHLSSLQFTAEPAVALPKPKRKGKLTAVGQ